MTPRQRNKYFALFNKVRSHWLKTGSLTSVETDKRRHALHLKALGKDKSSKALTNTDLDKIYAVFEAEIDPGNFKAQMAAQESPDNRRRAMIGRCAEAMLLVITETDRRDIDDARESYLGGIANNVCGSRHWPPIDTETLRKVMGIAERKAAKIKHDQKANGDPF